MIERFEDEKQFSKTIYPQNLPFITISREYGCPAKDIAALLVNKINLGFKEKSSGQEWRIISKEILEEASKELNTHPNRIKSFIKAEKRGAIDEILTSFSEKYYHSDLKIKKTLTKIIQDFALKGNVVIVGRGGIGVCCSLNNGFHVRLCASLDWRAANILQKGYAENIEDARKLAIFTDNKRNELIKLMSNKCKNELTFDITYNCSFFNKDEISDSIIYHLKLKGLL